jgi:Metallo-peptidase family M12/Secretion system C-terminal sorting domain/CUB domain
MKKFIITLALLASLSGFSQKEVSQKVNELVLQNVNFKHVSVLYTVSEISNSDTKKVVDNATFAKINLETVANLVANKNEYIEVEIPYLGNTITVQLYKVTLFAEGFHIDTDKSSSISYDQGVYYRGIIKDDANSLSSFSFFNNELNGLISNEQYGNLVIGKLDKQNNTTDYIIYSDADLKISNDFKCNVKDAVDSNIDKSKPVADVQSTRCVTMYFEIDNDLYQSNGSNTTTTTNWMTSVFNNVQTLYNNDGITISFKSLYIWTSQDPYDGIGTSSSDYLFKFNEVRPVFDGDVGQLLGIDSGGLGGVAIGINGLCTQDNFSYADVNFSYSAVPTFSWTIEVITHEFGHLLGSPHTHGCHWNGNNTAIDGCGQQAGYNEGNCANGPIPSGSVKGTIMSYCHLLNNVGINLANGFGPQPAALILSSVNGGTCLSTNCTTTCINTVASINVTNSTLNSATFSWVDASSSAWQVAVTPFTSTTPVWISVTTNSYSANSLLPNTFYRIRVRKNCGSGLIASDRQTVILTSANYCSGISLTDTGGTTGDYTDSETYIRTIIPNLPNKKISLTFTSFDLEQDYDYLYLYDGNSTSATDLSPGGFTGTTIPGPFLSSAVDGSLTLKFYSDGGVVAPGYQANVVCQATLGNEEFVPNIDFTYYPNPTNGLVTITSRTQMNEVFVYNLEGRLLYQKKINSLDTKVDISSFAIGTYFFKLKFNTKEANFKILKTSKF